jgi:hypothetical protein
VGFSSLGPLYFVRRAAVGEVSFGHASELAQERKLTSNVQTAHIVFLRKLEAEFLGVVVDVFDAVKLKRYEALITSLEGQARLCLRRHVLYFLFWG